MLSYDPDQSPKVDPRDAERALQLGLKPIQVMCLEDAIAKVGTDSASLTFMAFVQFVPRVGEELWLEDGKRCRVVHVIYKPLPFPGERFISMKPVVVAEQIRDR